MVVCAISFAQTESSAQEKRQEVSLSLGAGIADLGFETLIGNCESSVGWGIGLGYKYNINSWWSLNMGLELSIYNSAFKGKSFQDSYTANDGQEDFEFSTQIASYEETISAMYLNVPVMIQYEMENGLYASAGLKVGMPMSASSSISNVSVTNTGYYSDINITYDQLKFRGFGTFDLPEKSQDLELKLSASVSFEFGYKMYFSKQMNLYAGVYVDYGLLDVAPDKDVRFVDYADGVENCFEVNSALNSTDGNGTPLLDKMTPMSLGLKLRMALPF